MIEKPMDVLSQFPIRKSRKQKQSFRDTVMSYIQTLGYECHAQKGSAGAENVIFGDPKTAKYLITAHYDTCAGMPFPNLITPCNFLTFLAYQLLITVVLIVPAVILGILVGVLTANIWAGETVYFISLFGMLFLLMYGPANKNNANDNTSGVVTLLEIARTLPAEHRSKVCFVLFDLEEAGLIGSKSYRKAHKTESNHQLVLNLDCVGDGDTIMFFPSKKIKKDPQMLAALTGLEGSRGEKTIAVRSKGFSMYPSDQAQFPYGVGIAALHKSKLAGYYLGRIHTKKDTVLEQENVNILRDSIIAVIEKG